MEIITQCRGRDSDEVRAVYSILVQLGQERNSLNSFPQTLREGMKEDKRWSQSDIKDKETKKQPGGQTKKIFEHLCFRSHTTSMNSRNPDSNQCSHFSLCWS